MNRVVAGLAGLFATAAAAHADETVWDRAVADPEVTAARDRYARAMADGDEEVELIAANMMWSDRHHHLTRALASYRDAVIALPDEPEGHYRLASVEFTYFLACRELTPVCDPANPDPGAMRDVVDHLDAFTRLAPLDVRGTAILFQRAILHTKLSTRDDLLAAIADYEAYIDRSEGDGRSADLATPLANLAETLMMVGRLDDSIAAYERATALGGDVSTMYGMAVALDRDGQRTRARQIAAAQKLPGYEEFQAKVANGDTFFVPEGEVYYYFALVEEALGMTQQAIVHWDLYLRSGAHPEYVPRAKKNRDALKALGAKWKR